MDMRHLGTSLELLPQ